MSRKGIPNKITDEQRAWAIRVDRMLAKGSPDQKEGFDRLICRLLTEGEEQTKIALIRLMIPYRRGLPRENHKHEHQHLHVEMTVRDADSLIAGYLGTPGAATDRVGQSYQGQAQEQDIELLPE